MARPVHLELSEVETDRQHFGPDLASDVLFLLDRSYRIEPWAAAKTDSSPWLKQSDVYLTLIHA